MLENWTHGGHGLDDTGHHRLRHGIGLERSGPAHRAFLSSETHSSRHKVCTYMCEASPGPSRKPLGLGLAGLVLLVLFKYPATRPDRTIVLPTFPYHRSKRKAHKSPEKHREAQTHSLRSRRLARERSLFVPSPAPLCVPPTAGGSAVVCDTPSPPCNVHCYPYATASHGRVWVCRRTKGCEYDGVDAWRICQDGVCEACRHLHSICEGV